MRCDAVSGGKSVCIVVGSRYWSLTCLTNTFWSIIFHILTQQASQSGVVACSISERDSDCHRAVSHVSSRLLLNIRYAQSMVCTCDSAGGSGVILKILTKI